MGYKSYMGANVEAGETPGKPAAETAALHLNAGLRLEVFAGAPGKFPPWFPLLVLFGESVPHLNIRQLPEFGSGPHLIILDFQRRTPS